MTEYYAYFGLIGITFLIVFIDQIILEKRIRNLENPKKTKKQIRQLLINWRNEFYEYSSQNSKARHYPDFQEFNKILKELS